MAKAITRSLSALIGVLALASTLLVAFAPQASADNPTFPVMNTSETPPDGVWFRNSPHTADTSQTPGLGVFMGEQVQLVCYAFGDSVGPYSDSLWYFVLDISRPTNNGATNQGYLNAHYIDDGALANNVDSGVPPCGGQIGQLNNGGGGGSGAGTTPPVTQAPASTQPANPPTVQSIFFSPNSDPLGADGAAAAGQNIPEPDWAAGNCSADGSTATVNGTPNVLSGWSLGRLGVVYYLASASSEQLAAVHRIILFDPGDTGDFAAPTGWAAIFRGSAPCDANYDINSLFANWLNSDASNRLIIISGAATEEKQDGTATYAGLNTYYLADIAGTSAANQTLVCDYDGMDHKQAYVQYSYIIDSSLFDCPSASNLTQWMP